MSSKKISLGLIFCIISLFLSLGIASAEEKSVGQEIKEDSKKSVEEIKDTGKAIGKEGQKVGHDVKEGSKDAWQSIKDLFN